MLVQVTREHIRNGHRNDSVRCPISLSIRAMGYEWVSTCLTDCVVKKSDTTTEHALMYQMPLEGRIFVDAFDSGRHVEPIQFILDEPVEYGDD